MAMIDDVVAEHFRVANFAFSDVELIISHLDSGLYSAGKTVVSLRDQVLHGSPGSGSIEVDGDEISAALDGLLAVMGHLGQLVDQLSERTRPKRAGRQDVLPDAA